MLTDQFFAVEKKMIFTRKTCMYNYVKQKSICFFLLSTGKMGRGKGMYTYRDGRRKV